MDNRVPNYLSTLIIILLLSIFLLPRLGSHLRTEDILTPLIAIVTTDFIVIFMWKQKSQVLGIYQTIIYILYIFYITILNILAGNIPWQAIIVCGKEVQYLFIYILLVSTFKYKQKYYFICLKILIPLILLGALYGIYSLTFNIVGYYGIGYFNEHTSSSLSGLMYFNITVLSCLFYLLYKKNFYLITGLASTISALNVGSRITVVMIIIFLLMYILIYRFHPWLYKIFFVLILSNVFFMIIIFKNDLYNLFYYNNISNKVIQAGLSRAATILKPYETGKSSRFKSWRKMLHDSIRAEIPITSLYWIVFGHGRGDSHKHENGEFTLGLGGDSQYIVNIREIGLLGSFIFFYMLFSYYKLIPVNLKKFYFIYLCSYLIGGITMEIWQLSKGGQLFYIITSLLVAFPDNINQKIGEV